MGQFGGLMGHVSCSQVIFVLQRCRDHDNPSGSNWRPKSQDAQLAVLLDLSLENSSVHGFT